MAQTQRDYRELIFESYRTNIYQAANPDKGSSADEAYQLTVRPFLPANLNANILDAGCGAGALMLYLRRAGYTNVRGVDISPDQVAFCKSKGLNVACADVVAFLTSSDPGWDFIVSTDNLEHLPKPDVVTFLTLAKRSLTPNGSLLVHTVNASSAVGLRMRYVDFTHETAFTETSLRQVLITAGFTSVTLSDNKMAFGLPPKRLARWAIGSALRGVWRMMNVAELGIDAPKLYGKLLIAYAK